MEEGDSARKLIEKAGGLNSNNIDIHFLHPDDELLDGQVIQIGDRVN